MSIGENCAASKLRPPSQISHTRLLRPSSEDGGDCPQPRAFSGRTVGSIAARAQAWERCPASGYVTIGSIRYGVRFSQDRDVPPSRGCVGNVSADGDCCCGVVHLAWPRAGAPPSRIPLPPRANNNTVETPVYRNTLEVARPSLPGDGIMNGAPPTPTSLRHRFLVTFGNFASASDGETSRLIPPAESRDDLATASAVSPMQSTFDRFPKFRFGSARSSSSDDKNVKKKESSSSSGDKTEKLRELTNRLRKKPPASPQSPPTKSPKPSGLRSLFGSTTSLTGPPKESNSNKIGHKRAASVTSVAASSGNNSHLSSARKAAESLHEPLATVPDSNTVQEEEVPKNLEPESNNSDSQRPFGARSASFSQVDYNASDGKYSWKRGRLPKSEQAPTKAMTFPRKTHADVATSVSPPPPEQHTDDRTCSTPSVDSAVGSDEGFGLGSSGHLATTLEVHKTNGGRSLTYPLTTKKGVVTETIPFSSIDGSGLKSLHMSRQLPDVKEESSTDNSITSDVPAQARIRKISSNVPVDIHPSHKQEMLLPLENLGREIDELLVQQKSEKSNKPEIFITTWPKSYDDDSKSVRKRRNLTLNCDCQKLDQVNFNSPDYSTADSLDKSLDNDDGDRNSNSPQRWSGGTDSSHSARDCGSEPMSPDDTIQKPAWPKTKSRLVCQSSEERDDDRSSPKRLPISRNDSLSDGESDHGERCASAPRHDRDRTCSSSPLFPNMFDLSDNESRSGKRATHPRRYSKRPLRGPYGQMLEAEMKKPETLLKSKKQLKDELKFLEEYLPNERPLPESRLMGPPRARTSTGRSLDDSHLRTNYGTNPRTSPKRKVSANIPYSGNNTTNGKDEAVVCHQRTTSSPSELGTYSSVESTEGRKPSEKLLEQLLKGSSERGFHRDEAGGVQNTPNECLKDERSHVVIELVETESFYVESLQILVNKYLNPLKSPENEDLIDASVVDEIFYQIPEILGHHEIILDDLKKRLENWGSSQKVGDIILDVFTKQSVIDTYMSYISNWKKAHEAFKATCKQKPSFVKFLTNTAREHKGKLNFEALIIMPVQRIPHCELLIQRLIKNTDANHPDHPLLLASQRVLHDLAVKIDTTRVESLELEQQQRTLRDLETLIDGLADLPACDRIFLRMDTVTMVTGQGARKDRALFLFSDLLVITSIKRRAGPIKKPPPSWMGLAGSLDTNKYKLLRRLTLEDLEIVKTKDERVRGILREIERLTEDVASLNHLTELSNGLHCLHTTLDDVLKDMLAAVNKQLQERQTGEAQIACLEVNIITQNEENISVIFNSAEKRTTWEETFNEAKHKLALSSEHRPCPEFVATVPIRKTRAGLQFTCASPALGLNACNFKDVWVCNSDGYVGQVCVLSLQPEPNVISCNGVCNARILCVASVPSATTIISDPESNRTSASSDIKIEGTEVSIDDVEDAASDLDTSSTSSSPSDEDDTPEGEVEMRRSKSEPLSGDCSADDADGLQPAMWLGTEDGNIHVYNCSDNIRVKKNKVKIQHGSSVQCIIYHDNRVFVALANGDVTVYSRDKNGGWNTAEPESVAVGTAAASVTKMIPAGGRLWCGCHNMIRILKITPLEVEKSFPVSPDSGRMVSGLAVANFGVWIALHNSAILRLFHANTFECLCDVNVAPAVTKMLAGCDDIIRQHKAACLRVTSLLACKDFLWIGTSAGVVLTMPLPHVTASTSKLNNIPNVTGVPQGHTGHVRFLTSVETAPATLEPPRPSRHRHSLKSKPDQQVSSSAKYLVISGGDGYEDFRNTNASEVAGREDATNHLLLWQI